MTKFDPNSGAPEPTLEPVDFDPFVEAPKAASFALTEAQRELWAAVQMGPEVSCAYNQCLSLTLRGEVSVDALQRAVQRVFDRHESLRTRFDELGQSHTVQAAEPLSPSLLDLSGHPAAERPQRLQEVLDREVGTPLDLVQGPVARVTFVIEAPDLVHLVITAHHIVFDGHSSDLFFREVAAFYSAERTGSAAPLPPAIPFHRQVELEQSDAGLARAEAAVAFWKAQVSTDASALQLPTDHPGSARPSYRGKRAALLLTRVPRADVTKVASRLGATSTGLLLAAFQTLLYRLTGQGDVVVGLPVSARPAMEGDSLMGHATNLLVTRTRLDANTTFADVVRSARTTLLDCHDHQAVTACYVPCRVSGPVVVETQNVLATVAEPCGERGANPMPADGFMPEGIANQYSARPRTSRGRCVICAEEPLLRPAEEEGPHRSRKAYSIERTRE